MAPVQIPMRIACSNHGRTGCKGTCPLSAIVRGYHAGNKSTCRICGSFYPKPTETQIAHFPELKSKALGGNAAIGSGGPGSRPKGNGKGGSRPGTTRSVADQQLITRLQNELKAAKQQQAPADDEAEETPPSLDKQIHQESAMLVVLRSGEHQGPAMQAAIREKEAHIESLRAQKLQAKPWHVRQAQLGKDLAKARDRKLALQATKQAKIEAHKAELAQLDKDEAEVGDKIQKFEKELEDLHRDMAHGQGPAKLVDKVLGDLEAHVPEWLEVLPQGAKLFGDLRGLLVQITSAMEEARTQQAKDQADKAAKAEAAKEADKHDDDNPDANKSAQKPSEPAAPAAAQVALDEEKQLDVIMGEPEEGEDKDKWAARREATRKRLRTSGAKLVSAGPPADK